MEGKIQNPVLPSSCNSGLSSCCFSVLCPSFFGFCSSSFVQAIWGVYKVVLTCVPKGIICVVISTCGSGYCHPVITEAWVQSQAIPYWICDGHSDTHIGHYNSSDGSYSFVHPLIHLFIPSFICSFIPLSPVVCCRGNRWLMQPKAQYLTHWSFLGGDVVAQLVEALFYKVEGRRFDSRSGHWNLSWSNPSGCTMALVLTQPLTEMSTRFLLGGKGGQCLGLTTLPPLCADCLDILGALYFWSPKGLYRDFLTFYQFSGGGMLHEIER